MLGAPRSWIVCAIALFATGCASIPWPFSNADGLESGFTQEDLGGELAAFSARFASQVNNTSDEIQDQAKRRVVRRRALVWRLQMPPLIQEVAYGDAPLLAFFGSLLIATAQQLYLTEGDGRALFDDVQPLAVEAANSLVQDVLAIGERFLTKKQLAEVTERTREFAAKYPIQGRDFSVQRIPRAVVQAEVSSSLEWLIRLPLSPFTALQGVDTGAEAIRDFNRTAQEFAQIANALPERLRGQLELFAYDLEDRETVQRSVDALDRAATSAERAATVAEQLPDELRRMLTQSEGGVDAVGRVIEQSKGLVVPLADTATQLEQASAHWLAVLGPKETGPPPPDSRPFDVREWQAAAQSIGTAAGDLRGLAVELQSLSGANGLDAAVDRAFWRGVALIGLFFAALLGYRVITAKVVRS